MHPRGEAAVIGAVVVALSATVLWVRQSNDALLGADSIPGAVATVAFWTAPTLFLYVLLAQRPFVVAAEGAVLVSMFVAVWWSAATDWHSTASLGPGMTGWFLGPTMIVSVWLIEHLVRSRRSRRT